jgi:hypothetical protein
MQNSHNQVFDHIILFLEITLIVLQKFQELDFQLLHPPCTGVQGNFNDGKSAQLTFSLLKKMITKCY